MGNVLLCAPGGTSDCAPAPPNNKEATKAALRNLLIRISPYFSNPDRILSLEFAKAFRRKRKAREHSNRKPRTVHKKRRTARIEVRKFQGGAERKSRDLIVVEEPLTIIWQPTDGPGQRLSATMRTPGEDNELAAGLLFSEGLLRQKGELEVLSFCASGGPNELNRIKAQLRLPSEEAQRRLAHRPSNATPQSACGLCAFDELSNPKALLQWAASAQPKNWARTVPGTELLHRALAHLESQAPTFAATGASHAAIIVDSKGELLAAAEDVGRHNACDKAIGALFLASKSRLEGAFQFPPESGLLFSSRLSFELAAKAVRAGAAWIASVGAPTHLAIELARECGMPAVGFLSQERHNSYSSSRI